MGLFVEIADFDAIFVPNFLYGNLFAAMDIELFTFCELFELRCDLKCPLVRDFDAGEHPLLELFDPFSPSGALFSVDIL